MNFSVAYVSCLLYILKAEYILYLFKKSPRIDYTLHIYYIFISFSVGRLEEKEAELKREYSRLHDRYTELFKTHVDYMERTKMLVGSTERLESVSTSRAPSRLPSLGLAHMSRSSGPLSYGFQSLEASMNSEDVHEDIVSNAANLRTEMLDSSSEAAIETSDKSQLTDQPVQENKTTAISRRMLCMFDKIFFIYLFIYFFFKVSPFCNVKF